MLFLVVAVLLVAAGALAGVRLLRGGDDGPRPDQATPGAVLLVPGYGGNTAALAQLKDQLRAQGRTAEIVALPDGGTGDLEAQAATLDAAVRAALTSRPSVDIVGYSAGGVVARLWVDKYQGAEVARRIVTLGSPLHGTRLAAAGAALAPDACPPACRQLAPGSALLDRLDGEDLPEGLPWLSIWTENDETVQPPDSARLAGAVNVPLQGVCPQRQVSHSQLPTDEAVSELVRQSLAAGSVTAPASCPV